MGSKWATVSIDDIKLPEKYSCVGGPFGSSLSQKHYVDSGVPVIRGTNLAGDIFSESDFVFVSPDKANELQRNMAFRGDIVFTQRGTLGQVALIPEDSLYEKYIVSQSQMKLTVNPKQADAYFIYTYFRTNEAKALIENNAIVGGVPHINLGILKEFKLRLPPLSEQKRISEVSKSIDNKINLNRQINQTLEQMSQTLFKSWFVDFDPVIDNALDAGNPIPEALQSRAEMRQKVRNSADFKPLPADIRALFPAEFEEMDLGLIPKGWKFSNVDSLLRNTIGGDWGSDSEDEKHTTQAMIVRGTDIPELISGKLSSAPYRWVEPKKLEKRRINVGDIIIEVSGGSPTQSTGRSIFMTEQIIDRLGGVIEPASFCRKFEPLSVELGLIISLHLSKIYNDGKMWEYQNQSTGIANFQTKYFLEAEQIVIPSVQVINAFYRIVMPWIEKSHNNEQIILGNLRDTLLPKLISGELSLEDLPDLVTQTEPA